MSPGVGFRAALSRFERENSLLDVLGVQPVGREKRGRCLKAPCPLCGGHDRLSIYPHGRSVTDPQPWAVGRCRHAGDMLDWAMRLDGCDPGEPGARGRWLRERGYLESKRRERNGAVLQSSCRAHSGLEVTAPRAPDFAPEEVQRFYWRCCVPLERDPEVTDYLAARGIDPQAAGAYGRARALPRDGQLPAWAKNWLPAHRLVVPLYDAEGVLVSCQARAVREGAGRSKVLSPSGGRIRGTLFADALVRQLLMGNLGAQEHLFALCEGVVVVVEGVTDFLAALASFGLGEGSGSAPACLGVHSGSFGGNPFARLPEGCTVRIATDADPQGEDYARRVVRSINSRRVRIERVRPSDPGGAQ